MPSLLSNISNIIYQDGWKDGDATFANSDAVFKINDITLTSNSTFIGAEIIIKSMVRGYPIGEVGIKTYPRRFGESHTTSIRSIVSSIRDLCRVYREIFKQYQI